MKKVEIINVDEVKVNELSEKEKKDLLYRSFVNLNMSKCMIGENKEYVEIGLPVGMFFSMLGGLVSGCGCAIVDYYTDFTISYPIVMLTTAVLIEGGILGAMFVGDMQAKYQYKKALKSHEKLKELIGEK